VIQVNDHPDGCVVAVRAQPGARRNALVGEQNGRLKVTVTAPADQGKANRALGEVLADGLGLKRSQVELLSGPAQREKRFLLRGVTAMEVRARLQAWIGKER
jgi:uncharacterized protein